MNLGVEPVTTTYTIPNSHSKYLSLYSQWSSHSSRKLPFVTETITENQIDQICLLTYAPYHNERLLTPLQSDLVHGPWS